MKIPDIFFRENHAERVKRDILFCEHCLNHGVRCPGCVTLPIAGESRHTFSCMSGCCDFDYDGSLEQLFFEF